MWWSKENRRLERLEDRFEALARDFRALELDWNNVYDKVRKAMARTVKSAGIIQAKENGESEESVSTAALTASGRLLTPRQMQVQQEILKRRGGAQ